MRVRTGGKGEAFSLSFNFDKAIDVIPGKHSMSMYTLINCAKIGCDEAQDSVSVKVKDGDDGEFKEVFKIIGRNRDDQWKKVQFLFNAMKDKVYVRIKILTNLLGQNFI